MTHAMRTMRGFVHEHDDLPAFHAGYFVLTAMAAAMFNLGVFAMLVLLHLGMDIVKYREVHGFTWGRTLSAALRESLLDCTLLVLGLCFAVYLHHSLEHVAALSGMARAELTLIRAAALFGTKLKIVADVLGIFLHLEHYMQIRNPRLARPFSGLEKLCMLSVVVCLFLLVTASLVLKVDMSALGKILLEELVPGLA